MTHEEMRERISELEVYIRALTVATDLEESVHPPGSAPESLARTLLKAKQSELEQLRSLLQPPPRCNA